MTRADDLTTRQQRQGRTAEQAVAAWWQARGWRILASNYRGTGFEIDLVATKARTLVFIEVKARQHTATWTLAQFITPRKAAALRRGALHFISKHQPDVDHYRFDLCLYRDGKEITIFPDVLTDVW